jgi:flagellar biosynthetic protein FliR
MFSGFTIQLIIPYLIVFYLIVFRLAGAVMAMPGLGTQIFPKRIRIALVISLAIIVFIGIDYDTTAIASLTTPMLILAIFREVLVGLAFGFVLKIINGAVQFMSAIVGMQMGFMMASSVNPQTKQSGTILEAIFTLWTTSLIFVLNLHHVMLEAIFSTFERIPLGSFKLSSGWMSGAIDMIQVFLETGLQMAIPIGSAVFLTNVGLAITARLVPSLNIFAIGFILTITVGFIGIIYALPNLQAYLAKYVIWVIQEATNLVISK